MWFFKRKKQENNINNINTLKQQIYENTKHKMELNFLSPNQIEKIIQNNQDVDFLDDEIKKEMNFPDIEFIANKLLPPNIEIHTNRKSINPKDIVKAVCLGDIIGYKYEFIPHDYEDVWMEELPPHPSGFTDDTVLSIATMNAVLENPEKPDFRKSYLDAYKKYPSAGYGGGFIGWALGEKDNTKGYNSFGNGCAMRIAFISTYYEDINDVIKHTIESVMVTHNHIESVKYTVILSVCIWMALHNYSKEEIKKYVLSHCYMQKETDINLLINKFSYYDFDGNINKPSDQQTKISLYANYAVPYAIDCFITTTSYEKCMRKILSNFGDADTICAIAAGLCYTFYEETGFNTDEILKDKKVEI